MATGTINIPSVAALGCPEGKDRGILWDDSLRGFGVVAFRNGGKCYIVQYRQHGRSRRARIGDHPSLTPAEARKLARRLLGAIEGGSDPLEERRKARAVPTFGEIAAEFMRDHVDTKRKGRTGAEYKRILDALVLPSLGAKRVVDLKQADVGRMHRKLAAQPYQANRALALVSAIWNWAARRGEVAFADNPAKAIERYPERARERYLTREELARLGAALAEGESVGLPYSVDETNLIRNTRRRPTSGARYWTRSRSRQSVSYALPARGFARFSTHDGIKSTSSAASCFCRIRRRDGSRFI